jgi:hypothetical protein
MSFRDQVKYIQDLKRFEWKMNPKDKDEFKMFLKREKDEEEFDTISMGKLKLLYEKYYLNREKKNFDHIFKKN